MKYWLNAIVLSLSLASPLYAIPVNNDIALTVFDGQLLVREQIVYERKSGDDSPLDEIEHRITIPTVLAYGITQDLSLQVTIPYVHREFKHSIRNQRVTRRTHGLGDLKLVGKYEFYEKDSLGKTSNAAFLAGIEVPTGDTNDEDRHGPLERKQQVGKGSWNPLLALAYNWETFRHEFDASISYQFNTEAHDYEFGDVLHHNLSYQFRIWPWNLENTEGLPSYVFAGVELNGMWHQKDKGRMGVEDATGRYTLYASPTLQYISKRAIFEFSVQLPMIQKVNGEQSQSDFILRGGFRVQF